MIITIVFWESGAPSGIPNSYPVFWYIFCCPKGVVAAMGWRRTPLGAGFCCAHRSTILPGRDECRAGRARLIVHIRCNETSLIRRLTLASCFAYTNFDMICGFMRSLKWFCISSVWYEPVIVLQTFFAVRFIRTHRHGTLLRVCVSDNKAC